MAGQVPVFRADLRFGIPIALVEIILSAGSQEKRGRNKQGRTQGHQYVFRKRKPTLAELVPPAWLRIDRLRLSAISIWVAV